MERASEDAPLAPESRAESQQALIQPPGAAGGSNSRALKIAGITTLACLLLSAQVFTAYFVFDQRQRIQGLQMNNQRMDRLVERRDQVAPEKLAMPIGSLPLLDSFDDEGPAIPKASPKVQLNKTPPSVKEQLQQFMKDFELPHFNKSFLSNLQDLKQQVNETSWKNFESWLRYWLIFQTAQKASTPNPASLARTKCQMEATVGVRGMLGTYSPQCDEQGNYRSMQCLPSTGRCWCVNQSGALIQGSSTHGRPNCDLFLRAGRTKSDALMMSDLIEDE